MNQVLGFLISDDISVAIGASWLAFGSWRGAPFSALGILARAHASITPAFHQSEIFPPRPVGSCSWLLFRSLLHFLNLKLGKWWTYQIDPTLCQERLGYGLVM